jgi:hypothetical protein
MMIVTGGMGELGFGGWAKLFCGGGAKLFWNRRTGAL